MKVPTPVNSVACGCKFICVPIRSKVLPVNLNQADQLNEPIFDAWVDGNTGKS